MNCLGNLIPHILYIHVLLHYTAQYFRLLGAFQYINTLYTVAHALPNLNFLDFTF